MEGPLTARDALLRETAANHRAWFRRTARAAGGAVGRDVVVAGAWATIGFPRARSRERLDEALRWAFAHGARAVSCWALHEDRALGALLLARGFEWGWQPHWMALDLARVPDAAPEHIVVARQGSLPSELPYADGPPDPPAARHLVVGDAGRAVGHMVVNPWRGVAGIYDMGVLPGHRRRGIGRALTIAACRVGRELGCTHAVLNATGEGELLYRGVGFASLGWGRTWCMHPGPRPTPRQTELVEAIGFGDLERLAALRPAPAELGRPIPGAGPPLAAAVVTGQAAAAGWILRGRPDLVSAPVEPRGGTLLHAAVEWDDEAMMEVALAHGADRAARDRAWDATPLEWAERLGHERLAARLRDC